MKRRQFLSGVGAAALLGTAGCAMGPARPRVVVVGGGFGGATVAKYVALWSPDVEVTLVERNTRFTSCPMSNLVLGGSRTIGELQHGYDGLRRHGVHVVHDTATAVDVGKRVVRLERGPELRFDRVVLSPGIDFIPGEIKGYADTDSASGAVLHAWKAGAQTTALRAQLEAMPDGGVYLLSIPLAPYRCPPGPYERACQVASYFKRAKPRSKVIVLDANPDVTSKGALFKAAWKDLYGGIVEYRPQSKVVAVDERAKRLTLEFDSMRGDVLNVIPPQRAGAIAVQAGIVTHNGRWCDVDWRSLESRAVKRVHVLGDATLSATGMPKSGHMANAHAKVCASALVALLHGGEPDPEPVMNNTCYSFVSDREVVHVASVHQWSAEHQSVVPVKGSGGLSASRSELEGAYGWSWARNIWADMLA